MDEQLESYWGLLHSGVRYRISDIEKKQLLDALRANLVAQRDTGFWPAMYKLYDIHGAEIWIDLKSSMSLFESTPEIRASERMFEKEINSEGEFEL